MRGKAYRSTAINQVDTERLVQGKGNLSAIVGTDVGKYKLFGVCRWSDGRFERPWRVSNPSEVRIFVEGLLARHWPEAAAVLKLSSVTLLKVLKHYGSPQAVAADPEAGQQLARWSRKWLDARKIARFLSDARMSMGVRAGTWEQRRLQD